MRNGFLRTPFGPMYSEKTGTLQTFVRKARIAHKIILCFNHEWDTRYGENVSSTHDKIQIPSISSKNTIDVYNYSLNYVRDNKIKDLSDIVMVIDEAQFFDDEIIEFCREFKKYLEINVAFLDRNYLGQPFKFRDSQRNVSELIALADYRIRTTATCSKMQLQNGIFKPCGKAATLTQLEWPVDGPHSGKVILSEEEFGEYNKYIESVEKKKSGVGDSQIKVGARDYKVRCEDCFVHPPNTSKYSIEKFYQSL
ncbi:MAG: hypothetical protein KKE23_01815 [Nanoarchaeota archaeon]|nr:hypothetical protein [Nanoarchaeota archaeon]